MISFPRLADLPPTARLWLYVADRPLSDAECADVQARLDEFMTAWSSHGRSVFGTAQIAESRIVAVAGQIPDGDISGCGIDKSVHLLQDWGAEHHIRWLTGLTVAYRTETGEIAVLSRPAFRAEVRSGVVNAGTLVIDLAATTVGDLPAIERPARDSWHARVFGLQDSDVPA